MLVWPCVLTQESKETGTRIHPRHEASSAICDIIKGCTLPGLKTAAQVAERRVGGLNPPLSESVNVSLGKAHISLYECKWMSVLVAGAVWADWLPRLRQKAPYKSKPFIAKVRGARKEGHGSFLHLSYYLKSLSHFLWPNYAYFCSYIFSPFCDNCSSMSPRPLRCAMTPLKKKDVAGRLALFRSVLTIWKPFQPVFNPPGKKTGNAPLFCI